MSVVYQVVVRTESEEQFLLLAAPCDRCPHSTAFHGAGGCNLPGCWCRSPGASVGGDAYEHIAGLVAVERVERAEDQ